VNPDEWLDSAHEWLPSGTRIASPGLGTQTVGRQQPAKSIELSVIVYLRPVADRSFANQSHLSDLRSDCRQLSTNRDAGNLFVENQWFVNDRTDLSFYGNFNGYRQGIASQVVPLRPDGSLVDVTGSSGANYNIEGSTTRSASAWCRRSCATAAIARRACEVLRPSCVLIGRWTES
jgi:hypothetical protein